MFAVSPGGSAFHTGTKTSSPEELNVGEQGAKFLPVGHKRLKWVEPFPFPPLYFQTCEYWLWNKSYYLLGSDLKHALFSAEPWSSPPGYYNQYGTVICLQKAEKAVPQINQPICFRIIEKVTRPMYSVFKSSMLQCQLWNEFSSQKQCCVKYHVAI